MAGSFKSGAPFSTSKIPGLLQKNADYLLIRAKYTGPLGPSFSLIRFKGVLEKF